MAVSPARGRAPCSKPSLENTTAFRKKGERKQLSGKKNEKGENSPELFSKRFQRDG